MHKECINSPSSDPLSLTLSYYSSCRENIILILESINTGYKQKKDRSKINGPTIYLYIVLNFYPDLPSKLKSLQKKKKARKLKDDRLMTMNYNTV